MIVVIYQNPNLVMMMFLSNFLKNMNNFWQVSHVKMEKLPTCNGIEV